MRMFDRHVRTLMNVHHVLDLKENLLSLGALEAQGCKFSGADGGIKVSKGSMMISKGEISVNLYKMIGCVIFVILQQQWRRTLQNFGTCILNT